MNLIRACAFSAALLWGAGCATDKAKRPALSGDPLVDGPRAIQFGPPQDKVLWQYRMAAAAMHRGQYEEAEALLDEVLPKIGGIIASDKDAQKARSLFHGERKKTFIGEPYERVMAYYYRGILYWMDGELDNARACFRSAQFMDADTEKKTYAADYVLLDYLDGFLTAKLGGDGTDAFQRARETAKTSNPPPYHTDANVIVFLEYGHGPVKYATGRYEEQLRFRSGQSQVRSVVLHVGQQDYKIVPYDDLYYQATTRGGRVMDHILANKAVFKGTTDTVGDAAIISGLALAHGRNEEAAAIVGGLGVLSKIISAATTPEADTRTWDNLPQFLSFAALEMAAGPQELTVDFQDGGGRTVVSKKVSFAVSHAGKDTVLFVSQLKN